ncbi:hypothetical protein TREES_T100004328 [Tupaia chinensis]|uniref:Uncharacterized protein n=1 Tax=Tupaia chinensis TaxID=246437 RepID=L9KFA2_TUPCH|nr:hypothetical protein TREES_T100004328 [Tupaia chinensis]
MLCTVPRQHPGNEPEFPAKTTSSAALVALSILPLSRQADEGLFMTPLAKAKELVHDFLRLEEKLLHAVFQLFIAALKIRIHCPQMHDGGCVEEVIHGEPFHEEFEFI